MKESFILHTDVWPALKSLDMEQRGLLFTALMSYQTGEDLPTLDIQTQMAFMFMAAQLDRDNQKYQEICAKRAEYGRRGGVAKATKSKQKLASVADNDTDTDSDNDSDTDNETETDTEAQVRREVEVSQAEVEVLAAEFGAERAAELIEEVKLWAANNGKAIRDWVAMARVFARNQKRWGPPPSRDIGKLVDVAFDKWVAEQEGQL